MDATVTLDQHPTLAVMLAAGFFPSQLIGAAKLTGYILFVITVVVVVQHAINQHVGNFAGHAKGPWLGWGCTGLRPW